MTDDHEVTVCPRCQRWMVVDLADPVIESCTPCSVLPPVGKG